MRRPDYYIDEFGRPVRTTYPDGRTITYVYDEAGNMCGVNDPVQGSIKYQYDLVDRVTKIIYPDGKVLSYGYDPAGNRKSLTYPDGEAVSYNYGKTNCLTEIIFVAGRICFEYDKSGRFVKKTLPNGISIAHAYNNAGRLTEMLVTGPHGSTLFNYSYKSDAVGNFLEIRKKSEKYENISRFTYDPLYRLIRVKYPDGNRAKYRYDTAGNRCFMGSSLTGRDGRPSGFITKALAGLGIFSRKVIYEFNPENHLIRADGMEYKYDENGNLIEKNSSGMITRYKYGYENRLIKIEYPDGSYSQYTYNALGKRTSRLTRDKKAFFYVYDGHDRIQELNKDGRVVASYVHAPGYNRPVCMTRGGKSYYYLHDHIGSVVALSDESGSIVAEYEYDEWGNTAGRTG
ncbi:MAG: hypothetical protein AB1499_08480, partial [Nitrospirota bacterium]